MYPSQFLLRPDAAGGPSPLRYAELSEIPEHVRSKVDVVPAKTMRDVLNVALVKPPRRAPGATSRSRGPSARA